MSAIADTLVETDLERRFLEELRGASGEVDGPMERHCVRCFLFVELLAARRGVRRSTASSRSVRRWSTTSASTPRSRHGGVYTDEGGELAERLFLDAGATPERAELIRDACAQHHALRDQSAKGTEVELMRLADRIELSYGLLRAGLDRAPGPRRSSTVSRARAPTRVIAGSGRPRPDRAPDDRSADLQDQLTVSAACA